MGWAVTGLGIVLISLNLGEKISYRMGKSTVYRYPTSRDRYYRLAWLAMGAATVSAGIILLLLDGFSIELKLFLISVGIFFLLNALLDIPKGEWRTESGLFRISGVSQPIDQLELAEIRLHTDVIVFISIHEMQLRIKNVELNAASASELQQYILTSCVNPQVQVYNLCKN